MPTYTYECKKCGEFEKKQSMKDEPFTECPKCGGKDIKRLIGGGTGIIFKGSGFYETDYKKKKEPEKPACSSGDKPECKSCPHAEDK